MSEHILIYIVLNINIMHIVTHTVLYLYFYNFYFMLFYVTSSLL